MEAIGFLNFLPMFDVSTVTQDFNQDFNQAPKSILLTSFLFYVQFPSRHGRVFQRSGHSSFDAKAGGEGDFHLRE